MMRSFRHPVTNVLKAYGHVLTNEPGDLSRVEPDTFNLVPGSVRWNGVAWIPFVPPESPRVTQKNELLVAINAAIADLTIPLVVRTFLQKFKTFLTDHI